MVIGIACLGAGIFAREGTKHIPAIHECPSLSLRAVYSRSFEAAEALATSAGGNVDAYADDPASTEASLDDLLARADVQAVVVALPILVQPGVIRKALAAGKHVLSEKPIAQDVKTAEDLMSFYGSLDTQPVWGVAENVRYLDTFAHAARALHRAGGDITSFRVKLRAKIENNNPYYQTPWRQTPDYQGGFLLDGGIHFVAALRYLLGAAGQKISSLAAFTKQLQSRLPPVDTIEAILRLENGSSGTFSISFGMEFESKLEIEVMTSRCRVIATPTQLVKYTKQEDGTWTEDHEHFPPSSGVRPEMVAFAQSVEVGKIDERQSPEQALADLRVLQSMLESGSQDGAIQRF